MFDHFVGLALKRLTLRAKFGGDPLFEILKSNMKNISFIENYINPFITEAVIIQSESPIQVSDISSRLTNNITDAKIGLQEMKRNSPDRLILGHVNINSI